MNKPKKASKHYSIKLNIKFLYNQTNLSSKHIKRKQLLNSNLVQSLNIKVINYPNDEFIFRIANILPYYRNLKEFKLNIILGFFKFDKIFENFHLITDALHSLNHTITPIMSSGVILKNFNFEGWSDIRIINLLNKFNMIPIETIHALSFDINQKINPLTIMIKETKFLKNLKRLFISLDRDIFYVNEELKYLKEIKNLPELTELHLESSTISKWTDQMELDFLDIFQDLNLICLYLRLRDNEPIKKGSRISYETLLPKIFKLERLEKLCLDAKYNEKNINFESKTMQNLKHLEITLAKGSHFTLLIDLFPYLNLPEFEVLKIICIDSKKEKYHEVTNVFKQLASCTKMKEFNLNISMFSKLEPVVLDLIDSFPKMSKLRSLTLFDGDFIRLNIYKTLFEVFCHMNNLENLTCGLKYKEKEANSLNIIARFLKERKTLKYLSFMIDTNDSYVNLIMKVNLFLRKYENIEYIRVCIPKDVYIQALVCRIMLPSKIYNKFDIGLEMWTTNFPESSSMSL